MLQTKFTARKLSGAYCFAVVFLLAGCSTTDVISTGAGTYMVSSTGGFDVGARKATAFQKAGDYCKGLGEQLQTINTTSVGGIPFVRNSSAEVDFRCIKPDDSASRHSP